MSCLSDRASSSFVTSVFGATDLGQQDKERAELSLLISFQAQKERYRQRDTEKMRVLIIYDKRQKLWPHTSHHIHEETLNKNWEGISTLNWSLISLQKKKSRWRKVKEKSSIRSRVWRERKMRDQFLMLPSPKDATLKESLLIIVLFLSHKQTCRIKRSSETATVFMSKTSLNNNKREVATDGGNVYKFFHCFSLLIQISGKKSGISEYHDGSRVFFFLQKKERRKKKDE